MRLGKRMLAERKSIIEHINLNYEGIFEFTLGLNRTGTKNLLLLYGVEITHSCKMDLPSLRKMLEGVLMFYKEHGEEETDEELEKTIRREDS